MRLILSWLILSLAVWVTSKVLRGFRIKDGQSAFIVAAIFGFLNFLLAWLMFVFLSFATLGIAWLLAFITRWIINALLLMLTDKLTDRLKIDSFGWALGAAFVIAVVGTLAQWMLRGLP
jgi:putative membrane protein